MISPHLLLPDYCFSPPLEILAQLGCGSAADLVLMVVVTLRERLEEVTANLQGVVLLNPLSCLGLQLVVENYPVRHPIVKAPSV